MLKVFLGGLVLLFFGIRCCNGWSKTLVPSSAPKIATHLAPAPQNISTSNSSLVLVQSSSKSGQKPDVIVTFVNGIFHTVSEWKEISDDLGRIFNCEVRPFYNPSSGWWIRDLSRAGFDLVLRPSDLLLSKELADHIRSAIADLGPHGRVLHLAHSGGAILTYLAAKHHLSRSEISRMDVITFGAGKSITHKYFKGVVRNYYSRNDPLVMVDNRANKLLQKCGGNAIAEVTDAKHNTSFIYLEPLENHPVRDHAMEGRTYGVALRLEAMALRRRLLQVEEARAREERILRRLRKQAAAVTGMHHFWDSFSPSNVRPEQLQYSIRKLRKEVAQRTRLRGWFSGKYSYNRGGLSTQNPRPPAMVNESTLVHSNQTISSYPRLWSRVISLLSFRRKQDVVSPIHQEVEQPILYDVTL